MGSKLRSSAGQIGGRGLGDGGPGCGRSSGRAVPALVCRAAVAVVALASVSVCCGLVTGTGRELSIVSESSVRSVVVVH